MRMMAVTTLTRVAAAALMLGGCGERAGTANTAATAAAGDTAAAPVRRQPGRWLTRVEVTRLEAGAGIDTAKMREGMQAAMNAASGLSLCVTPEAAARESGANIEQMAQGRNCKFGRKVQAGERLDFAGVCTDARGQKVRVTLSGTTAATAQDLTVAMSPVAADSAAAGALQTMELRVRSTRTGACRPGDVTPPVPTAPAQR